MELRIRIAQARPLRGVLAVAGRKGARFDGWLELLRALGDVLADGSGQLDPAGDRELHEDMGDVGLDRPP